MDRALESEKGIAVDFDTHGALVNFRQRCYMLRLRARDYTRNVYEVGNPGRGKSAYDELKIVDATERNSGSFTPPFRLKIIKLGGVLPDEIKGIVEL
jgi:hypothetical protein